MGEQGQGECTEGSLWGPVGFLVSVSVSVSEWKSLSHVRLFATPWKVAHQALCPWDSPGKNTGVDCHFPVQGIFPTQRWNIGRLILYYWATRKAPTGYKSEVLTTPSLDYINWLEPKIRWRDTSGEVLNKGASVLLEHEAWHGGIGSILVLQPSSSSWRRTKELSFWVFMETLIIYHWWLIQLNTPPQLFGNQGVGRKVTVF